MGRYPVFMIRRLKTDKMTIPSKLIYRLRAIYIKRKTKLDDSYVPISKELQSYSHCDTVMWAQLQTYRLTEQNLEFRSIKDHICNNVPFSKGTK